MFKLLQKYMGFLQPNFSSGGGGSGASTQYTSNIPEYAKPYVMNMLGAAQNELFNTKPTYDESGKQTGTEITGMKGYQPFSTNVQDYFAGPTGLQKQTYGEAMGMQTPSQFGAATNLGGAAGYGALGTVNPSMTYGGMGAGYGQQGAGIGLGALNYGGMGAGLGMQAAGAGNRYAQQATNPNDVAAYMSPYMQNVTDVQKAAAVRDYQKAMPALQAAATKAGAFGGTRGAVERAEAQRGLMSQLQNIQAQGLQNAFQNAQAQQQFGANLGLQGLQAGMQGAGVGLQGISGALAGTAQGMQGAQTGLQGVQGAQAGYNLANTASSNLANIGAQQQQADLARMNFQNQLGQQQQAYQQQLINQQIQDYATQQQYPLMQLSTMSNLLRGLPMQSTNVQSYMPTPSLGTQAISGLGTLYGVGKGMGYLRAGGEVKGLASGGTVPGYAGPEGSVVSSDVERSMLAKLEALASTPAGLEQVKRIAETSPSMEQRKLANIALRDHMEEQQAAQQAEQSIAQDQAKGLAQVPAPVMDTMEAASGGIIAFANEGEVEYDPNKVYGDPYQVLSDAEAIRREEGRRKVLGVGEAISPEYRQYLEKQRTDMPTLKERATGWDIADIFSNMYKSALERPGQGLVGQLTSGAATASPNIRARQQELAGKEKDIATMAQELYGKERADKLGILTGTEKEREETLKRLGSKKEKEIQANASKDTFTDRLAKQYFKDLVTNYDMDPKDPATMTLAMKQAVYDYGLAGGKLNLQSEAAIIKGEKDSKVLPTLRRELLQLEPGSQEYIAKQAEIQAERDKIRASVESKTPGRPEAPKAAEKKDTGSGRFPKPDIATVTGAPDGSTIGAKTAKGWEVKDKNGTVIGYAQK